MRRDHRPKWLRDFHVAYEKWWVRHFLAPQLEALGPNAQISSPWAVEVFGAGVSIGAHLHVMASRDLKVRITAWPSAGERARVLLGDCVLLTGGTRILAAKEITIGDGCMLAKSATVTDCDWHGLYDRVSALDDARPVHLGTNVWIGDSAFVGKGVSIGDNAIVGARAVVVRDVPANAVVAGNPARIVKELDPALPRRTRMDLYADPAATHRFMEETWARLHGANTFADWLRTKVAPRRGD